MSMPTDTRPVRPNSPAVMDPFRYWITVVGMGQGGASVFGALVDKLAAAGLTGTTGFLLMDERPVEEYGRGIAWSSTQHEAFRANMRLHTIGFKKALIERIKSAANLDSAQNDISKLTDNVLFHQRRAIGDALHADFDDYLKKCSEYEIPCHILRDSAHDIDRFHNGYVVRTKSGSDYFTHFIILSIGNFPNNPFPELRSNSNYLFNPWKWDEYKEIKPDNKVLVLGLGPTAVDTIFF